MKILQKRFYNVWGNEDPWEDSEGNKVDYPNRVLKGLDSYDHLLKKYGDQPDSVVHYINKKKKMKVFSWYGDRDTLFSTM
ncbi:MAG: penicillin-binding protein, partial [Hymenobacter sp.]